MSKPMELVPVRVMCYAGYKADEHPKCFYWDDIQFDIKEILDRWYQGESSPENPPANYYKVRTVSSGLFILKFEIKRNKWFLVI